MYSVGRQRVGCVSVLPIQCVGCVAHIVVRSDEVGDRHGDFLVAFSTFGSKVGVVVCLTCWSVDRCRGERRMKLPYPVLLESDAIARYIVSSLHSFAGITCVLI
jgi:hypothetical protein